MPVDSNVSRNLSDRGTPIVVRFRPLLRLAPRPVAGHETARRAKRAAIVIRFDDRRAPRKEPVVESPSGAWLIFTATMLLSMLAWRFLR